LKGLNRGLLIHYSNIISKLSIGVRYGFSEFLKLVGLGFKYKLTSYYIYFVLGFSHIIKVPLVFNITIRLLNKKKIIQLESHDYFLLHFFIHYLKSFRPLDVYKAKGIRLKGEVIVTKIGKQSAF
jgi:ribosomal protein L6P/L9E